MRVTPKHLALVVVVLAGCGNTREREAQDKLDRQIEESAGLYRDTEGRSYKITRGIATYIDARGGTVPADRLAPGAPRPAPQEPEVAARPPVPDPPETDVTRGEEAAALGDHTKSAGLYKKACDANVPGGCGHLALLHREGQGGVKKDPVLAESMAKKECDAGDGFGCYALGIIYETVVRTDGRYHPPADAITVYDKGCTAGSSDACSALGMLYHSGRGGAPQDPAKAAAALQRSCDLGDRIACHQVDMVKR